MDQSVQLCHAMEWTGMWPPQCWLLPMMPRHVQALEFSLRALVYSTAGYKRARGATQHNPSIFCVQKKISWERNDFFNCIWKFILPRAHRQKIHCMFFLLPESTRDQKVSCHVQKSTKHLALATREMKVWRLVDVQEAFNKLVCPRLSISFLKANTLQLVS
jgi:hypothetical protein